MTITNMTEGQDGRQLTFTRLLPGPARLVYRAFTTEMALREWLADRAHTDAREGGGLFLGWARPGYYMAGIYTELKPEKRVAIKWQGIGEPGPTDVAVDIEEQDEGVRLTLTHGGLGVGPEWDETADEIREGWETGLDNLEAYLERGEDLRVTGRPFLGIILGGPIAEERAQEMGLPAPEGILVTDTISGTGAEEAGVQHGDVIVSLGGARIADMADLVIILEEHDAGDVLDAEIYRAGERLMIPIELSKRPLPDVPDDPNMLAQKVEDIHDELNKQLRELLEGVSDDEASKQPAKNEWSAKQVLAHLIHSERDTLYWLATAVSGAEVLNFPDNLDARIDATLTAYPKLGELLDELRCTWTEQRAMVKALPDTFVERKRTYKRVGEALLQSMYHPKEHFKQIRDAVEAARS